MTECTLNKALENNENFIIVLKNCPFCNEALKILKSNNIEFAEYDSEECSQLAEEAKKKYEHRTFPIIVLHRRFIGGCSELKQQFN